MMDDKIITLACKRTIFRSLFDKCAFFGWIDKIPSIIKYEGIYDTLYLSVKSDEIPDEDLRELLALFFRYKIDMKQLQVFLKKQNKKWFHDGKIKGYWYTRVFGKKIK